MFGTVLIVYAILCLKPQPNPQYFACGSTTAILLRTSCWLNHSIYNFFFHIGIFKFLCNNRPSKVSVPFIGDLNFGSKKILVVCCDVNGLQQAMFFMVLGSN